MANNFKNSYLRLEGISEDDFFETLSYRDLFNLIRYFQREKRKNFQLFMECLQKQVEQGPDWPEGDSVDLAKILHWKKHLHYENLVAWCFKETCRRTKKNQRRKGN